MDANGPYSSGALWAMTSAGRLDSRFGSGGNVLTQFGGNRFNEFLGLTVAPSGALVAVGDTQQSYQGGYTGIAARYIGLGAPPPPPNQQLKASLTAVKSKYKTGDVAKHGLSVGVSCNQACSIKGSLVLSAGTARTLRIKTTFRKCTKSHGKRKCRKVSGYRAVTIGSGRSSRGGSGTSTLTLKLINKYLKALQSHKSFSATLKVSVTSSATHKSKSLSKGLTFTH